MVARHRSFSHRSKISIKLEPFPPGGLRNPPLKLFRAHLVQWPAAMVSGQNQGLRAPKVAQTMQKNKRKLNLEAGIGGSNRFWKEIGRVKIEGFGIWGGGRMMGLKVQVGEWRGK